LRRKDARTAPADVIKITQAKAVGVKGKHGQGKVGTYTIMTVPPTGFEKYTPYAWVIINLDNSDLRISGFLPNIQKSGDLPIGAAVKVVGFDDRGIVLKKL